MRLAVVGALLLAGCGGPPGLAECEKAIKRDLRSPSTYERVSVGIEVAGEKERFFDIEYDAANAYGTPVREDARCYFDAVSGDFLKVGPGLRTATRRLNEELGE